jgi:hypothetical protein
MLWIKLIVRISTAPSYSPSDAGSPIAAAIVGVDKKEKIVEA